MVHKILIAALVAVFLGLSTTISPLSKVVTPNPPQSPFFKGGW